MMYGVTSRTHKMEHKSSLDYITQASLGVLYIPSRLPAYKRCQTLSEYTFSCQYPHQKHLSVAIHLAHRIQGLSANSSQRLDRLKEGVGHQGGIAFDQVPHELELFILTHLSSLDLALPIL